MIDFSLAGINYSTTNHQTQHFYNKLADLMTFVAPQFGK